MILYFTTQKRFDFEQVQSWLPGRFDSSPAKREVSAGPNNEPGVIFCRDDMQLRFDKDSQIWHRVNDKLSIGWNKATPPTPDSLARSELIPGHKVKLAGQDWTIPLVREWSHENGTVLYSIALAKAAKYDAESKTWQAGDVIAKQQRLFELAQEVYELYTKREEDQIGFSLPENPLDVCAEVLAANYRIGPEEISCMGLLHFSFESAWSILSLVIDEPGMQEAVQKKMDYVASLPVAG